MKKETMLWLAVAGVVLYVMNKKPAPVVAPAPAQPAPGTDFTGMV